MSSTDVSLSLVATLYTIYCIHYLQAGAPSDEIIVYGILCALLTYIGFSHWNAGYPMWVTPFLTIHYVTESSVNKKRANAILFCLFFASLFAYNVFSWWHALVFSWTPYYSQQIRTIVEFLSATTVALNVGGFATSLSQSILAGVCTVYILLCVRIMLRRKSHGPVSSGDSRLSV